MRCLTRSVLPHEERSSEYESPLDPAVLQNSLERHPEALTDCRSLLFQSSVEECHFFDNVYLVRGQVSDPAQVFQSLLTLALRQEPSRAFVQPKSSKAQETTRYQLYSERDEPLRMTWSQGLVDAVVDLDTVSIVPMI